MRLALSVAFAMLVVAPLFGRWRANVWLKRSKLEKKTRITQLFQP
jgi:hypothetical protein